MSPNRIVVGDVTVVLNGGTGKLEVTKNGVGLPSSGHGVDIKRCQELYEALNLLRPEVDDPSDAFLLDNPRVHLGLRLGAIALAEGLIKEKVQVPGLSWVLDFFGSSKGYHGSIVVDEKIYPLTIHETNFVSGRDEIYVDW